MTPDSHLKVHINDQPFTVAANLTILEAARQHGIAIPTLCDYPGLPSPGSCRMCIVEIQGRQNTPTACTTPVEDGMVVYTHSPRVMSLRRELMQMLLAEHPSGCIYCPEKETCHECMVTLRKSAVTTGCRSCPKDRQCELAALASQLGVDRPGYPVRYRMHPVANHDPFFDHDDNLCILCGRCIRICEDLHFTNTLSFTQRGERALVGTAFYRTHLDSSCTFCGSCVEVCPTGALSEKTRKWTGAAESQSATTCPFCAIGCQITLDVKNGRVIGSLPDHQAGSRMLCVSGRFGITELVNNRDRLLTPLEQKGGSLIRIRWPDALRIAAQKLAACAPDHFEMRISASSTNEDIYVARQFAHQVMKSERIYSAGSARDGYGWGKLDRLLEQSFSLEALDEAPLIMTLGFEDRYAYPVIENHLVRAKKRGAEVIHFGSEHISWAGYSDKWLPVSNEQIDNIAASLLQQAQSPAVLLGPDLTDYLDRVDLFDAIEQLSLIPGIKMIVLPGLANQNGLMRLGLSNHHGDDHPDRDVLYLIGEKIPQAMSDRPFTIYQNISLPNGDCPADLVFPAAAFTELKGTFTDYAGRTKLLAPAVSPPGEALPSWMILCRIAQAMGSEGFEYTCVEDIWQAAQQAYPGFPAMFDRTTMKTRTIEMKEGSTINPMNESPHAPSYLGLPLTQWVEGLRSLYPTNRNGGIHASGA
ncbi:MAG: molybdopterin-dependent oxidoreductase [Anaerolineaceae bacterium]